MVEVIAEEPTLDRKRLRTRRETDERSSRLSTDGTDFNTSPISTHKKGMLVSCRVLAEKRPASSTFLGKACASNLHCSSSVSVSSSVTRISARGLVEGT